MIIINYKFLLKLITDIRTVKLNFIYLILFYEKYYYYKKIIVNYFLSVLYILFTLALRT